MTDEKIAEVRDYAWDFLASAPLRRAMLGRERCDAIVRVALDACAEECGRSSGRGLSNRVEDSVRSRYRDRTGMPFMSLLVWWAISAIVQALVARWWSQEGQP